MRDSFRSKSKTWWRDRFVTLMVIPERTRRVHKLVIPFFLLKLGVILISLSTVFTVLIGIDYVHVLGRMAENKRLKGENFKLRQDIQLIRNKVDSMESTVERVRNYAKKLQLLTEQGDKPSGGASGSELPWDKEVEGGDDAYERSPASKGGNKGKRSRLFIPLDDFKGEPDLTPPSPTGNVEPSLLDRVEKLQLATMSTEQSMSHLQIYMLKQSAVMNATPSLLPIQGWLSSPYGYRRHPLAGVYRLHAGVDIAAEPGTPVRAPADGLVIFSGFKEGYGKVVVIDHGYGIRTLFGHSSKLFVNAGTRVKRGEKLTEVGSTGRSTGPHLHYEIRKNGHPVNPATFFSRARF